MECMALVLMAVLVPAILRGGNVKQGGSCANGERLLVPIRNRPLVPLDRKPWMPIGDEPSQPYSVFSF